MIALYIALGVILFIFIVLHFFVTGDISASKDGLDIKVKFLFFTLYPKKKRLKNKKAKKRKNRDKQKRLEHELEKEKKALERAIAEAASKADPEDAVAFAAKADDEYKKERAKQHRSDEANEDGKKKSLGERLARFREIWEELSPYLPTIKKAAKRLLSAIRLYDIDFYLAVADEDAYECAMKYGRLNILVYNVLTLISLIFKVRVKRIFIESRFNEPKGDYSLRLKIKVRPSTLIAIGFCGLMGYLYVTWKNRKRLKKIKETELQKT